MNYKHQENGALRGPLVFTAPAYDFVMALCLDWLESKSPSELSLFNSEKFDCPL